jgi:MFS transporter, FSR family, fosmidomycin resistance protein
MQEIFKLILFLKFCYTIKIMSNNSSENTQPVVPGKIGKSSVFSQWGGKFAFFFTYLHTSHDLTTGLLAALLPFIREDLHLDYLQAGLLVTAFSLTAGLSQLLGGWLSDRISKRNAITIGLCGVGLSCIVISFAPSYYYLLGALILLGVFSGFYHPSSISALTNHFPASQRGKVVNLHMLGGGLGFAVGPLIGAVIAATLNWHFAYAILGIPAIIAGILVRTRLKLTEAKAPRGTPAAQAIGPKIGVWQVFKPAILLVILSVFMQLIAGPLMSFFSLYLVDVHHLSATAGSMWVTVIRFGGLAGNIIGGWLTDKWGRRNMIFLVLIAVGPIVFLMTKLPFGVGLMIVLILFGWLMTMRETTTQTILMDNAPPRLRATIIGIYFSFGQQGSSIIQPIAGNFMDTIGIVDVFSFMAYLSIGLSIIAIILAFRKTPFSQVQSNTV